MTRNPSKWIPAAALLAAAALTLALQVSCASTKSPRERAGAATSVMAKPDPLPSPARDGSGQPRLTATADGAVLMSWIEPNTSRVGAKGHSMKIALLKGSRWSPVLTIAEGESLVVNSATFPAACPFGAHGLAVAWLWKSSRRADAIEVRISVSSNGGENWSKPAVLHDDVRGAEHGFLSLFEQGTGVRAVWLDGHNLSPGVEEGAADMTLHSRFISPSGALGKEQEIDERVCDCCQTSAVVSGGDVVVAYRDRDANEVRDISVVRLDGGKWSAPITVREDGWKMMGCPVNGPALAANGSRVAVAWYTAAADTPRVWIAFSENAGKTFGPATRIDDGNPMGRVGVALMSDGRAAVSWLEADKTDLRMRVRWVRASERPGTGYTVARLAQKGSGFPQLVRDGNRLVMAWTDPGKAPRVKLAEVRPPSARR